ncbi:2-oxoglutarate dehydrogenase E1 component [Nitrosomonas stercoris]|uniref:2-oxoglutarate dehydrogenase E1 component n=1 Tax=Nitrosomonas stercoris TaxID=1444684 RepID=A0A4Y1YQ63_9PROT|nr:2-oxoglutarate dehydrogenase E1 component [Nitrosomonas stercoris]
MTTQFLEDTKLFGSNAAFIEMLYDQYLDNPANIPDEWRQYFDALQPTESISVRDISHTPIIEALVQSAAQHQASHTISTASQPTEAQRIDFELQERKQIAVLQLINAYRFLGVRRANLDPLNLQQKQDVIELDPEFHGLSDEDLDKEFHTGSLVGSEHATLREILHRLQLTYCGSIGAEYMHITDIKQKRWLQNRLESVCSQPHYTDDYKHHILERLTAAEGLERYLHTRYVGQKRFSGEGNESLIPMLDKLLQHAGTAGVQEIVMGMAHRARLSVLVNTLGKMPYELFQEFEGKQPQEFISGDVKYHQGFSSAVMTPGGIMRVALAFNPSHLEIVNPVVEGSARARQHRLGDKSGDLIVPVLIHGDAAFAGQGVVMETLSLSQTRGYGTGGTIHIVINNQIGFTTSDPRDSRSSLYCTDVVKMIDAPVLHVNGDDPDAVILATEIAFDFRMQFHKDIAIDLVCFRKLGHNEQDEPMVTQPSMYRVIHKHPGIRKLYADRLVQQGVIEEADAEAMVQAYQNAMDEGHNPNTTICYDYKSPNVANWAPFVSAGKWNQPVTTAIPIDELKHLSERLTAIPDTFQLHPRVEKVITDRRKMGAGNHPLDWGMAESLAYASLLIEGCPVRISGQDSGRGTFFHRHAVLHDQSNEQDRWEDGIYVPLRYITPTQADFTVIDSILSEEAVLAFEYGYATARPDELVIWEAQFGDFANGAQVVIDQFIASGEAKWGRLCGLVLFLPHGYEGQGPEHSSARLERFLQLCAEYNIQICIPSTPAQIFHLLRRQIIRSMRKPLIVITPKSMLRHKEAVSALEELSNGQFQPVISETETLVATQAIKRLIVCSGKIYYELLAYRREHAINNMAIIRLEQLYPFPHEDFQAEIDHYVHTKEVLWCQEEPGNQGAWHRIQHYLLRHMRPDQTLGYALRPSAAAPSVGYLTVDRFRQKELIEAAFRDTL